jgi:translation initiation factor IF-1
MTKVQKEVFQGRVIEALPDLTFKIELENGRIVFAYLSGKMALNKIRLIPGDSVLVEISPYDKTRGRIIKRL